MNTVDALILRERLSYAKEMKRATRLAIRFAKATNVQWFWDIETIKKGS